MTKRIFIVVCLALLVSVASISVAFAKDVPINEQIMYGHVERTDALVKINEVFLQRVDAAGVSREDASIQFAQLGWKSLGQGDVSMAARRFNQAWILNPDNYLVYWAFGIIAFDRDNRIDLSSEMFEKALFLKKSAPVFADYGRVCEMAGEPDKAISLFKEGLGLNPKEKRCYVGLMRAYGASKDWKTIRYWLNEGEKHKAFTFDEIAKYKNWITESEKI
jgi:tetratricopeptide (TPR) repeat protein